MMHTLTRWEIEGLIQSAVRGLAERHEVYTTNRNVDRLEYSLRELSAEVDRLRNELQACKDQMSGHI